MKFYDDLLPVNSKGELYNALRSRANDFPLPRPGRFAGQGVDFSHLHPKKPNRVREFHFVDMEVNLSNSDFSKARFYKCRLQWADFSASDLSGTDFSESELMGAKFTGCDLSGANFRDADLSSADFGGAELEGADFTGADLSRTSFHHADLTRAITEDADLTTARLHLDENRKHRRQMKTLNFFGKTIEYGLHILTWVLIGSFILSFVF